MLERENTKKAIYPYNLFNGDKYVKKIKKLVLTAKELGGTMSAISDVSGLSDALDKYEDLFDDEKVKWPCADDMTVVIETYVRYPSDDRLERIFLYSDNMVWNNQLLNEGTIEEGKFVINYDRLKSVHKKGYSCLYSRENDKDFEKGRFRECFGESWFKDSFSTLEDKSRFIGNGINYALRVKTQYGAFYMMPDIYAVEQCMKVYYAENIIREKYDAEFSAERIDMDECSEGEKESVFRKVFNRADESCKNIEESYSNLIGQIAYIKFHYQNVYDTIWNSDYHPDDEPEEVDFNPPKDAELGLCIAGNNSICAVCRMENGEVKRVINPRFTDSVPMSQKYWQWNLYIDRRNPGMAGSKLALILRDMMKSAGDMYNVDIRKVYMTSRGELPDNNELLFWNNRLRQRRNASNSADSCLELIAFDEIGDENIDGEGVLRWSAKLAGIPQMEYVDNITAVLSAFENKDVNYALKEQDTGLIVDFNEKSITITLLRRQNDNGYEIVNASSKVFESENYYKYVHTYEDEDLNCTEDISDEENISEENTESEQDVGEDDDFDDMFADTYDYTFEDDCYLSLYHELGKDIKYYMLDEGLSALGIYDENEKYEDALHELENSAYRVKRQFRRNDNADVFYKDDYFQKSMLYPIERFEQCFKPVLNIVTSLLYKVVENANYKMKDISKVYLVGEECEYPFVRKEIEEITGKKGCCISPFDCVDAIGAVSAKSVE